MAITATFHNAPLAFLLALGLQSRLPFLSYFLARGKCDKMRFISVCEAFILSKNSNRNWQFKELDERPSTFFLVACARLYTPLCRSVGWSVGRLVGPSVGR